MEKVLAGFLIAVVLLLLVGRHYYPAYAERRHAKQDAAYLIGQYSQMLREYDARHNLAKLFADFMAFRPKLDQVQSEFSKLGIQSPEIDRAKGRIWEVRLEAYHIEVEDVRKIVSELMRLTDTHKNQAPNP